MVAEREQSWSQPRPSVTTTIEREVTRPRLGPKFDILDHSHAKHLRTGYQDRYDLSLKWVAEPPPWDCRKRSALYQGIEQA